MAVCCWNSTTVCRKEKLPAVEVEWSVVLITNLPWDCRAWQVIHPECRRVRRIPARRGRTDRAKPSGWASTLESGDGCTIWTMLWTSCAASSLTPTRHPSANCPRSPLCCWPRITSWCKPTRWTNCDGSSLTWTKPPDYPFQLPWRPWWPTHPEVTSTLLAVTLMEPVARRHRWHLGPHRRALCRSRNRFATECWPSSRAAAATASLSPGCSISHRQWSARPPTTMANNPLEPKPFRFDCVLFSFDVRWLSAHLSANMTTKYLI